MAARCARAIGAIEVADEPVFTGQAKTEALEGEDPLSTSVLSEVAQQFDIGSVGVIGAGQMGSGIAQVCAVAGFDVLLSDISVDRIETGLGKASESMSRLVRKGHLEESAMHEAIARMRPALTLDQLEGCDLVIEAATENEKVKNSIFEKVCPILRREAVLATNTSSISITRLAASTDRPERFLGLHFSNPVPLMRLVEVIRGIATDEAVFEVAKSFVTKLGKRTVVAEDYPGFIINRVLMPMINEAIFTLYEGIGDVESIDEAMRSGANQPMGPLQLADFIGLDTCLAIIQVLHDGLADPKYRPCPLLVKYVEAGWLGRKSGRGFYDYRSEIPVATR